MSSRGGKKKAAKRTRVTNEESKKGSARSKRLRTRRNLQEANYEEKYEKQSEKKDRELERRLKRPLAEDLNDSDLDINENEIESENEIQNDDMDLENNSNINSKKPIKFSELIKIAEKMPQWDKTSVSHTFLRTLESKLDNSGLAETDWIRILPHLFDAKTDLDKIEWINTNIVKNVSNWKLACVLFNENFQLADHRVQLEADYAKCKQGSDTVQDYATKFKLLCTQLGLEDSNDRIILQFIKNLNPSMIREYYNEFNRYRNLKPSFEEDMKSLEKVCGFVIGLEVQRNTVNQTISTHSGQERPFKSKKEETPTDSKPKSYFCKFHPDSNSHDSVNCRLQKSIDKLRGKNNTFGNDKRFKGQRRGPFQGKPGKPWEKEKKAKIVTCHACNNQGHYANDPSCPAKKERDSQRAASNNSNINSTEQKNEIKAANSQPFQQKISTGGQSPNPFRPNNGGFNTGNNNPSFNPRIRSFRGGRGRGVRGGRGGGRIRALQVPDMINEDNDVKDEQQP